MAHWQSGQCVATNYRTKQAFVLTPRLFDLLEFLSPPRSHTEVASRFGLTLEEAGALISLLIERGVVDAEDSQRDAADLWNPWDPSAGQFHFLSRDTLFNDNLVDGERAIATRALVSPPPSAVHPSRGSHQVPLRRAAESPLAAILKRRRTWREFARRPVTFDAFSTMLQLTFGVQQWARSDVHGKLALKTFPSGGACHPLEAYVAVVNVKDLAPGLYHYRADVHALSVIRRGLARADLKKYIQAQPWFSAAAFVVFIAAVFERTMWRYPTPRAYRNILLEAGHACQTFCLLATELELAPFCTHALFDTQVDNDLGLDGVREGVIYAAGCGAPPKKGWSPNIPGVTKWMS